MRSSSSSTTAVLAWKFLYMMLLVAGCSRRPPPEPPRVEEQALEDADEAAFRQRLENAAAARTTRSRDLAALLVEPSEVTLYSISPNLVKGAAPKERLLLRGYPVRATVQIAAPRQLRTALRNAILDGDESALCFFPRHALRWVGGSTTLDILICFECHTVLIYGSGEPASFPIASSLEPQLNKLLGLP